MNELRITSFNCHGVKGRRQTLEEVCDHSDVVAVQEHWLPPDELPLLSDVHHEFRAHGVSAMDPSNRLIVGRPYGGVAVMWKRSLDSMVDIIETDHPRVAAIKLSGVRSQVLIVNVYCPYFSMENMEEFIDTLAYVHSLLLEHCISNTFIVGDFNCNPGSPFWNELTRFTQMCDMIISDYVMLPQDSFTYFCESNQAQSWLDHIVASSGSHSSISSITILHDIIGSDHFPITVTIDFNILPQEAVTSPVGGGEGVVRWGRLSDSHCAALFAREVVALLPSITHTQHIQQCNRSACKDPEHIAEINRLYSEIINIMKQSGRTVCGNSRPTHRQRLGWNDLVKDSHLIAREAFLEWIRIGKPRQGVEHREMIVTRARFKYALRNLRKEEDNIRNHMLSDKLAFGQSREFWSKIKSESKYQTVLPLRVGEAVGEAGIAQMWTNHFSGLLNSTPVDICSKETVDNYLRLEGSPPDPINEAELSDIFKHLPRNKAIGADDIPNEAFINAPPQLISLFVCLFNSMFQHRVLPSEMMKVILVPLIKNRNGNINDPNNYRPIALATASSKIFEKLLLIKVHTYLSISDYQFGFKADHSTDMAIFTLKETVNYYLRKNSSVFTCFLDLSKAFDMVNHYKLFKKLVSLHIPQYIVEIMAYWYCNQKFNVRWGGTLGRCFGATNGVRQGSLLSPILFNIYTDDLNRQLASSGVGCFIGETCINNISYADDMCIIGPSASSINILLKICYKYASDYDLKYNVNKSVCMCIRNREINTYKPKILLNNSVLEYVDEFSYLGHVITSNFSDENDICRHYRFLCIKGNTLKSKFSTCHSEVKTQLFKSFCSTLYGGGLWSRYTQLSMTRLKVIYNNAFRFLMKYPMYCSASEMFALNGVKSFGEVRRTVNYSLMRRCTESRNSLIQAIMMSDCVIFSPIQREWSRTLFVF